MASEADIQQPFIGLDGMFRGGQRGSRNGHRSALIHAVFSIALLMFVRLTIALLLGATISLVDPTGSGQGAVLADDCLSREQIRAAVENGEVAPLGGFVGDLRRLGDVVSSELCYQQGRLVYVVQIVTADGQVKPFVLDAGDAGEPDAAAAVEQPRTTDMRQTRRIRYSRSAYEDDGLPNWSPVPG